MKKKRQSHRNPIIPERGVSVSFDAPRTTTEHLAQEIGRWIQTNPSLMRELRARELIIMVGDQKLDEIGTVQPANPIFDPHGYASLARILGMLVGGVKKIVQDNPHLREILLTQLRSVGADA